MGQEGSRQRRSGSTVTAESASVASSAPASPSGGDLPFDIEELRQMAEEEERRLREQDDVLRRQRRLKFRAARAVEKGATEEEISALRKEFHELAPDSRKANFNIGRRAKKSASSASSRPAVAAKALPNRAERLAERDRLATRLADLLAVARSGPSMPLEEVGDASDSEDERIENELRELRRQVAAARPCQAKGAKSANDASSVSLLSADESGRAEVESLASENDILTKSASASKAAPIGREAPREAVSPSRDDSAPPPSINQSPAALDNGSVDVGEVGCKGTGKGKGKQKGPPPPPGKGPPLPKKDASIAPIAVGTAKASSRLLSLHWKVMREPEDTVGVGRDFLRRLDELGPSADSASSTRGNEPRRGGVPPLPATIFRPAAPGVFALPREVLEYYCEKNPASSAWKPHGYSGASESVGADGAENLLGDKRLHVLGVVVQKHLMAMKGYSAPEFAEAVDCNTSTVADLESRLREAVTSIQRGILRCDFKGARVLAARKHRLEWGLCPTLEGLSQIRTVLRQHEKDNRPLAEFVKKHGAAALDSVAYPAYHRLVFELSKVPQIDERLECMIFHMNFEDSLAKCRNDLLCLCQALDMLKSKISTIRKFFNAAHRLGQSLNRHSNTLNAPRGFALSTLEKLSQTRSTKLPKYTALHFVLALMGRDDAEALFTAEDTALLHSAKVCTTHKVYQDSLELMGGIYSVQQICTKGCFTCPETGQEVRIERRRKTMCERPRGPSDEEVEPEIDGDDDFHEVMQEFVDAHLDSVEENMLMAGEMILTYKELAIYFDDLRSVYPPPKNDKDTRQDICAIFYNFAKGIARHREEVEHDNLRELLAPSMPGPDAASAPCIFTPPVQPEMSTFARTSLSPRRSWLQ